ncbi:MAG: hypothetical protein HKN90_00800 [Flavobacteriaceae bacterium]|nr:hypothetical protein [Flavobacteriaceae bacterium]
MKRKAIATILIILLLTFLAYKYIYKEHRNITDEKAVLTIESSKMYLSFKENEEEFNRNFLDKTVQVQGNITRIDHNSVVLDSKSYVIFKDSIINSKPNGRITIKGRYVGYDDLLDQIKIDQATLIKD